MTTDRLLAMLAERGLRVELGADGKPHLRGETRHATPTLLEALKIHRPEIAKRIGATETEPETPRASDATPAPQPEQQPDSPAEDPDAAAWALLGRLRGAPHYADVYAKGGNVMLPPEVARRLSDADRRDIARLKPQLLALLEEAALALKRPPHPEWTDPKGKKPVQ